MVVAGLTLAGVPFVTARLPGVITPVPLAKTAVRLELAPAVMAAGFATKLVIVGAGGAGVIEGVDPPQPVRSPKPRLRTRTLAAQTTTRFTIFPLRNHIER